MFLLVRQVDDVWIVGRYSFDNWSGTTILKDLGHKPLEQGTSRKYVEKI